MPNTLNAFGTIFDVEARAPKLKHASVVLRGAVFDLGQRNPRAVGISQQTQNMRALRFHTRRPGHCAIAREIRRAQSSSLFEAANGRPEMRLGP